MVLHTVARFAPVALLTLAAGCAATPPDPSPRAGAVHARPASDAPLRVIAEAAGGLATSVDEAGVPTFIWSARTEVPPAGANHEAAARFHLARFAAALALPAEAQAAVEPAFIADRGDRGVIVQLRQRVHGVLVYGRQLRLLMRRDHSLVALSGSLHPGTEVMDAGAFSRPPEAALAGALSHMGGVSLGADRVAALPDPAADDRGYFALSPGSDLVLSEPATVRKVLFPEGERLRPAWQLEFYAGRPDSADAPAWRYLLADDDGSVLERVSLTQSDAFTYRVWTDGPDNRPLDGPIEDMTPHPTGRPDWRLPRFVHPNLVSIEGFNKKTPNRKPDPWLPVTAKDSQGNNADAYTDTNAPDGFSANDFRASTTSALTFDRTYDLFKAPIDLNNRRDTSNAMAGIIQAFYLANWLHDYWYDSGFDEPAGNAQQDNYSRGGVGHDRMKLESQDNYPASKDNSNMSTPGDGQSPRMQIYVWTGAENRTLHIDELNSDLPANTASFGPDAFAIDGNVVEVNDNTFPSPTDACQDIQNKDAINGNIALIDRGNCTFKLKSVNAEAAGAIGIILVNNTLGDVPRMGNGDPTSTPVGIGILSTSKPAGANIRAALATGPVTAHLAREKAVEHEGSLDNSVLAHEWGHYLHHRLAQCGAPQQCNAMSEGWADFVSLHTAARAGDNLDGTFALAIYASAQFDDPAYFGIRRYPYSVNFARNPLTLKYIADGEPLPTGVAHSGGGPNSEVHNAGEIWTTMMWEAYVALHKSRVDQETFDDTRRRMADYVVAGLQLTPPDATYLEQRDAIVAAAGMNDADDQKVIADAFARRGAGTCADAPPRTSQSLTGVVEGFKVQARLVVGDATLDDSTMSCDNDGVLDAGEKGHLTIDVANGALAALTGAKVTLTSLTEGVTIVGQSTFDIPELDPLGGSNTKTTIATDVAVAPSMAEPTTFTLRVEPSEGASCDSAPKELHWKINYDVGVASTAIETFGIDTPVWEQTGDAPGDVWSRVTSDDGGYLMHAADVDEPSDTALESPELQVSAKDFFVIHFEHRHSFNIFNQNGTNLNLDGGVIEIKEIKAGEDTDWTDISTYAQPGYEGTIASGIGNPLSPRGSPPRRAFIDKNSTWPKRQEVVMNLVDKFAGKTVKVRFRMATIGYIKNSGWDLGNIRFKGIDNLPFTGTVQDNNSCAVHVTPGSGGCALTPRPRSPSPLALLLALPAVGLWVRRRRSIARGWVKSPETWS